MWPFLPLFYESKHSQKKKHFSNKPQHEEVATKNSRENRNFHLKKQKQNYKLWTRSIEHRQEIDKPIEDLIRKSHRRCRRITKYYIPLQGEEVRTGHDEEAALTCSL